MSLADSPLVYTARVLTISLVQLVPRAHGPQGHRWRWTCAGSGLSDEETRG
jgi:hypothetical protein